MRHTILWDYGIYYYNNLLFIIHVHSIIYWYIWCTTILYYIQITIIEDNTWATQFSSLVHPPTMSYQLIAEFQIGSPARSLSAITAEDSSGEITIYCGSQDALLHKLIFNPTTGSLDPSEQPISHNHWVVSTLSMRDPGSPLAVVTGCQDGVIRLFDATGEKIGALEGHTKGVISLCRAGEGQILSGSWDGTAKLWDLRLQLCIRTFGPHENGVHVLYRSEELLATVR